MRRIGIVAAITALNSRHLTCQGARAGAEIELEHYRTARPDDGDAIAALTARLADLDAEMDGLRDECERLYAELAALDRAP